MRDSCLVVLLILFAGWAHAAGRPYTVDDMLRSEALGRMQFDRAGGRLWFERQGPYDRQSDYGRIALAGTRPQIQVIDLEAPAPAVPLSGQAAGSGYAMGVLSPDGGRLSYLRTDADGVTAGVFDLRSGGARTLDFSPDFDFMHATWAGEGWLVVNALPTDRPVTDMTIFAEARERQAALWREQRRGVSPTAHAVGSGRYAGALRQAHRLVLIEVDSGRAQVLAEGKFPVRQVSGDARFLAALRDDPPWSDTDAPVRTSGNVLGVQRSLHVYDLQAVSGRTVCTRCDVLAHSLSWSPDGRYLAFVARDENLPWQAATHRIYDRRTGATRTVLPSGLRPVIQQQQMYLAARAAWLSDRFAVLATPAHRDAKEDARADWYLLDGATPRNLTADFQGEAPDVVAMGAAALAVVHRGRLWAVDLEGRRTDLGHAMDVPVRAWRDDEIAPGVAVPKNDVQRGDTVVVRSDGDPDGAPARVWFVDVRTGAASVVPAPSPHAVVEAASKAARRVAFVDRAGAVGRLVVADVAGSPPRVVAEVNQHLANVDGGTPVKIPHLGPGGDERMSWLLLPPGYRPGQRVPTVVVVYPGYVSPTFFDRWTLDKTYFLSPYLLAARGYAVLRPSLPLDYHRTPREPLHGMAEEVLVAVDAAVAAGYVDDDRVALLGHSYGGYTTAALLSQTRRFKTGVAVAGLYNLFSAYGVFDPKYRLAEDYRGPVERASWAETGQGGMGAPPWADPQRYLRNSPLMRVREIEAPLMLVHGDIDFVSITQSEEMFTALTRLGKDALFVQYMGENHEFVSPANIRDLWNRVYRWYDEHIGPTGGRAPAGGR